jgi:hypothetical protein
MVAGNRITPGSTREARMALARVGSSKASTQTASRSSSARCVRASGRRKLRGDRGRRAARPPEAEKSVVILFFEAEDDDRRGDEALNPMPAGDTPGCRTSVLKYDVAIRMTD